MCSDSLWRLFLRCDARWKIAPPVQEASCDDVEAEGGQGRLVQYLRTASEQVFFIFLKFGLSKCSSVSGVYLDISYLTDVLVDRAGRNEQESFSSLCLTFYSTQQPRSSKDLPIFTHTNYVFVSAIATLQITGTSLTCLTTRTCFKQFLWRRLFFETILAGCEEFSANLHLILPKYSKLLDRACEPSLQSFILWQM